MTEDLALSTPPEISLVTGRRFKRRATAATVVSSAAPTALLIDFSSSLCCAAAMGLMAYIGYKVGLAAHQRTTVAPDNDAAYLVAYGGEHFFGNELFCRVSWHGRKNHRQMASCACALLASRMNGSATAGLACAGSPAFSLRPCCWAFSGCSGAGRKGLARLSRAHLGDRGLTGVICERRYEIR